MIFKLQKTGIAFLMLLMPFFWGGCATDWVIQGITLKCHHDIGICERKCEWSKDGKTLSVYCSKIHYCCRDPFEIMKSTKEIVETHDYSLTVPEPESKLCRWKLVPSESATRFRLFSSAYADLRYHETDYPFNKFGYPKYQCREVDYDRLVLPLVCLDWRFPPDTDITQGEHTLSIHPDDLHFFQRPFVIQKQNKNALAIPYKLEDNICHFYLPKEDLGTEESQMYMPNASNALVGCLLIPPALVYDIATFPVYFCMVISDISSLFYSPW